MKEVDDMISDIVRREGGFVDHPNDRGGPTKYGITQRTFSNYVGYAVTTDEVRNLQLDVAEEIYRRLYYFGPGINTLVSEIQPFLFDSAVNHGPRAAIKFLQRVCNQAGYKPKLSVDGAVGPNSRKGAIWAHAQMGGLFLAALLEERRNFYFQIVDARPSQKVFLNGWINRISEFEHGVA